MAPKASHSALYFFSFTYLLLVELPTHAVRNLMPSWRENSSWSLSRTIGVHLFRRLTAIRVHYQISGREDRQSEVVPELPKGTGTMFVWVPAMDGEVLGQVGVWTRQRDVASVRLPAYWFGVAGAAGRLDFKATADEKVVLHFHGGAYVIGAANTSEPFSYMPSTLAAVAASVTRAIAVEYRLSASAPYTTENAFPTALVDAISAYTYLLSIGFKPSNILISGDSAGGNLSLALIRYLVDNGLATPGGLILFSPWVDMTDSHFGPDSSRECNRNKDWLAGTIDTDSYAVRSFLGGWAPKNPYISPACKTLSPTPSFSGFPPTYIALGDLEIIVDEIQTLVGRMEGQIKGGIVYDQIHGLPHDYCLMSFMEPERLQLVQRIARWIDGL